MSARAGWYLAAAAILAASLALREAFPIMALANAHVDDQLFVRMAEHIAAGEWLGPYDHHTLAKGAAFPAFIALNSFTGIPLKITEHVIYLSACVAFAAAVRTVLRSRAAGLACLAVLAFNPVLWSPESGGRVVRDGLYASLGLWILALAVRAFLAEPATRRARERPVALAALGVLGGIYWVTREEGVWLIPSLMVIVGAWAARNWRPSPWVVAVPLAAFAAIVATVNAINYAQYGVFRNNEIRSRDFQQGYGALQRIAHENPRPYVLFPADARAKAYRVSPAARELAHGLEGPLGENWRRVGCETMHIEPCPEILSGWLMWALRDAAAAAGHHASALRARAYYRTLGREVNEACDRGLIACGPQHASLVPPWRPEFAGRIAHETWRVAVGLATLGDMHAYMRPSAGTPEERAFFARMTHDPQASDEDGRAVIRGARMEVARWLARAQVATLPIALPLSIAAWAGLLAVSWRRREWHAGHFVAAALVAAIVMRVGLLGFIGATSFPPNIVLYLTPVTPMTLALVPFVAFLGWDLLRRRRSDAAA